MTWTKRHSQRAVAKRARLRMERGESDHFVDGNKKVFTPRTSPDFTINIRSRSGDRLQITATRFGQTFIIGHGGTMSARGIARGIEMMLRHATP